ncbi:hypothetical protein GLOTRDRAFT_127428 [Gloeophyllum trabeum ATCC 11539]|uniref:Uncharacterized protein n=1 Tax=Gloeophyllum trabeum (strain ATCC 11539 / FP-39264 / Madison 617) TaxID=670483 RepID=S7RR31_GLOTA|nr:uncharacterized protein GLOTRDRAFT_127428 [Gloeophyllum trabeum ATCC 11539]EPQ57050.1 hypothetical protein GLOTRDRAFT_127428 [Gloeophyllum trabeum ATCC 11539]
MLTDVADQSYIGEAALNSGTNWNVLLNRSNDDAQIRESGMMAPAVAEVKSTYCRAKYDKTLPTNLPAVWWSTKHDNKHFLKNEQFLQTLRLLEWKGLSQSGLRNSDGLYNDGLVSDTCQKNGQAVVAAGLGALGVANQDMSLFDEAERLFRDELQRGPGQSFFSRFPHPEHNRNNTRHCHMVHIRTKHLQNYLDQANDSARTGKYSAFLGAQAFVADAKYGPC